MSETLLLSCWLISRWSKLYFSCLSLIIRVGRVLKEVSLSLPIRYADADPIERWLHQLLCLDVGGAVPRVSGGCPPPNECQLYLVNRDTLFCYHRASEEFLQRLMSLYVASHYKNTPNDLQLLSDAPAHQLYVLLGPVSMETTTLPEILCVIQASSLSQMM